MSQAPDLWKKVENCIACGGSEFAEYLHAPDPHYGNKGLFRIVRCKDCGLQFLDPMPTQKFLDGAYPDDYYAYGTPTLRSGMKRAAKGMKDAVRPFLFLRKHVTLDPRFAKPGTMLDIGCGTGQFLLEMKAKGWEVKGVEVSDAAAEAGRRAGLDIFGGTLLEAKLPSQYFDYVRSNHSFEHIENPREVLREIRRIIKPDGKLLIGVPNVDSWAARAFGPYWFNLGPPVHPYGYSPKTLKLMLEREGFAVERTVYNSKTTGITGSLQIYINRNKNLPSHVGGVVLNPFLALPAHWMSTFLDATKQGDAIELTARPA